MADVYGTVAGFQAYYTLRGRDITDWTDPEIQSALVVASEWLDPVYRANWSGIKVGRREQVRDWPRTGAFDVNGDSISSDSVPVEVENATYEAAYRQLQSPGSLSIDYTPSKYTSVDIEGAIRVVYAERSVFDVQGQYAIIDQILSPLMTGSGAMSALSGKVSRA